MGTFLDKLILEDIDGCTMKVIRLFRYVEPGGGTVAVQPGFVTDFASVPRLFWRVFPRCGPHNRAAVVHDWLYARRRIETGEGAFRVPKRNECDWIFLCALKDCGIGWLKRNMMWSAVRIGGGWVWAHGEGADPERRRQMPNKYFVDTSGISVDDYGDGE